VIGGEFVLIGSSNYFLLYLTEAGWNRYQQDLAFRAEFSSPVPVPEPSGVTATHVEPVWAVGVH